MTELSEAPRAQRRIVSREDFVALGGAVLYLAFFVGMSLFNAYPPRLPSALWALLAPLTTVVYLIVLVYAIRLLCRQTRTARQETVLMFAFLIFFLLLNPTVNQVVDRLWEGESLSAVIASLTSPDKHPVLDVLVPFFLILTGVYLGQLLARLIRERAMLVPVLFVSALIDLWGVYWGPVSSMTAHAPMAVSGMATASTAAARVPAEVLEQMPRQLALFGNIAPPDNIGIGDFVFLAFFLTCAYRLGFSVARTMWGIFAGLLLASLVMALDGQTLFGLRVSIDYLPGLLFISGGVLLANLRAWKLSRQEWIMTAVCVGIIALLVGVFALQAYRRDAEERRRLPRGTSRVYTLPVTTDGALVAEALSRLPARAGAEMLPLHAQFRYARETDPPQLERWLVLAVARRPQADPATTPEFIIRGKRGEDGATWQVQETTTHPAAYALRYLPTPPDGKLATALDAAEGLPAAAFDLLKEVGRYAGEAGSATAFYVLLSPASAEVADEQGRTLMPLPYPAGEPARP